ncbi:gamma-glutamyl-gamma-aminobutyrate hydrolase family protein [Umezawaea sp. Da 62-37]|uniref:gamma-glutamyl-gamma-aminobutyrate hydrolase family protein n=1 Tax=Umezawaea sp. Da 62-37 TaxID=3075927 RepID=UPI0028F6CD4E|nr:gamma-glutamyl-gamma-aminobutyrate hydrolase family protein [Umezawaea sp. Da 62-37]WNV88827.1 gamma-glutamyl-gamma-aminobutyrate hydrolase family protein [Umezawaea sp. Da 62-37]
MASSGSDTRPLIGLSTYLEPTRFGVWDVEAAVLHGAYLDSVRLAGGNPVLLPPGGDWRAETLGWLDGLVLTGGADIDPASYGQEPGPLTGPPRRSRDDTEFALLRAALELDLPVLGVCRGAQLLNIALGGTLHQHVPGHNPSPGVFARTEVEVVPDSALAGIVGDRTTVHCHHHQALDVLGAGLRVVATAPDGLAEAVELTGARFVLGVQSHPEQDIEDVRLFAALVRTAKERTSR